MTDKISFSQLNMALRCPYQYYLRYVEGLKIPPDGAQARGQAAHNTLLSDKKFTENPTEGLLSARMQGEVWTIDQTIDTFNDKIEARKYDVEWSDDLPYEDARRTGQEAVKEYHKFARDLEPQGVEVEFSAELLGVPLIGYIDLVTEAYNADLKVRKRKMDLSVSELMQLGIYNLHNHKPYAMIHSMIIRAKGVEVVTHNIEAKNLPDERIKRYLETFMRMREKEIYPPCSPDNWSCSPDFCGFYKLCKYAQGNQ